MPAIKTNLKIPRHLVNRTQRILAMRGALYCEAADAHRQLVGWLREAVENAETAMGMTGDEGLKFSAAELRHLSITQRASE